MAVFRDANYMGVVLCAQFGTRCAQRVSDLKFILLVSMKIKNEIISGVV